MFEARRIIQKIEGSKEGPILVFFGGIHGNEKAGVYALKEALNDIDRASVNGTIYGIAGNLKALSKNYRYVDEDLNRIWTFENIEKIKKKKILNVEEKELLELLKILELILSINDAPLYFIDLHTTSSKTLPFITINDALINRAFSKQFPVPVVLGIEEYLEGPLLSYINQMGYVSLGFESGQHDDIQAVKNNVAFIKLALVFTGCLDLKEVNDYQASYKLLEEQRKFKSHFFEIAYLYSISKSDNFKMHPGFKSFQKIKKGDIIATNNQTEINSKYNSRIFMPLYQKKGAEGFFLIKTVKPFFLRLSSVLRVLKVDGLLSILPGIAWLNKEDGVLKVNLKIARFMAKPLFHLLGYRSRQVTKTHLYLYNRERVAKTNLYKGELWN